MAQQMREEETSAWTDNVWTVGAMMLVIGLVVGFVIGWNWQKSASGFPVVDETQSQVSTSTAEVLASSTVPALASTYKTIDEPAFVSVDDQKAGALVFIKHTEVTKPTWIAVRGITTDNAIGNIIGAGMVTSATDDVPVTLLKSTVADQKYAVFLYQDNGDGKFDFKTDLLIMQNSLPVATVFTAQ